MLSRLCGPTIDSDTLISLCSFVLSRSLTHQHEAAHNEECAVLPFFCAVGGVSRSLVPRASSDRSKIELPLVHIYKHHLAGIIHRLCGGPFRLSRASAPRYDC